MKKQDDYIAGSHHSGIHFWCGLVFGGGIGAWVGWSLFDGGWGMAVTAMVISLTFACSCGRWGDRAWQWLLERLHWIT
jgi:hypothetical protein